MDPSNCIVASAMMQKVEGFESELFGRNGMPGRLVKLENQVEKLREDLPAIIKEAVAEAMKVVTAEQDYIKRSLREERVKTDDNTKQIEKLKNWKWYVLGVAAAFTGIAYFALEAFKVWTGK